MKDSNFLFTLFFIPSLDYSSMGYNLHMLSDMTDAMEAHIQQMVLEQRNNTDRSVKKVNSLSCTRVRENHRTKGSGSQTLVESTSSRSSEWYPSGVSRPPAPQLEEPSSPIRTCNSPALLKPTRYHNNIHRPHSPYGHHYLIRRCNSQAHVKQNILPKETRECPYSDLRPRTDITCKPVHNALVKSFSNHSIR